MRCRHFLQKTARAVKIWNFFLRNYEKFETQANIAVVGWAIIGFGPKRGTGSGNLDRICS